jgi:hypothetical protein
MKLKTIQFLIKYQHVLAQVLREHAIEFGVEYTTRQKRCSVWNTLCTTDIWTGIADDEINLHYYNINVKETCFPNFEPTAML